MKNNIKKLFALSACCFLLTSCGNDAISKPDNYEDKLVESEIDIPHNEISVLWDKIHDSSSTPSDVRDALEEILSETMFGNYKLVKVENPQPGQPTSKIILEGYDDVDDAKKVEFINSHHYYQDQKIVDNKMTYQKATEITPTIEARINFFKDLIYKEVVAKLFEEANTTSYKYRSKFDEKKFARSINTKFMSSEGNGFIDLNEGNWYSDIVVDYTYNNEEPETIDGRMLHVDRYADYINSEYIPTILETLLTEQYIYDEIYSTIGRTLSRQVSYIQLSADNITNDPLALMKKFADKYILDETTVNKETEIDYTILQEAYKGDVFGDEDTAAKELINSVKDLYPEVNDKNYIDGKEHPYHQGTKYGDIFNDYSKISYNDKINDTTIYNDFTGSGLYSPEIGLQIRLDELKSASYTSAKKWATKDEGFSSLSDYSSLLFDYTLSSNLHDENPEEINGGIGNYVKYINGHYFLLPSSYEEDDPYNFILSTGTTYTIVEVHEAVTQSWLDPTQNVIEDDMERFETIESTARTIGYSLANKDTYKNTALSFYLKQSSIKYYDTSVYEYFKENLPELFEDK